MMFTDGPIPSADKTSPRGALGLSFPAWLAVPLWGKRCYGHQEGQWAPGSTPSQTTRRIVASWFLPPAGVLTHFAPAGPLTLSTDSPLGGSTILSNSLHSWKK